MESNKLLIGVTFYYLRQKRRRDGTIAQEQNNYVQEFVVPRDATLKQLMDGIKYGLMKRITEYVDAGDTSSAAYKREYICLQCCIDCLSAVQDNIYPYVTITSFDGSVKDLRFANNRVVIHRYDEGKKLYELGFLSSTRLVFDNTGCFASYPVVDESTQHLITQAFRKSDDNQELVFPKFNISNRQLYQFDQKAVEIIPPSQVPQKPKNTILMSVLPALVMAFSMILMRSMISGGSGGIAMYGMYIAMALTGVITSFITFCFQRREYRKNVAAWRKNYQNYIDRLCADIEDRQKMDKHKLEELYPAVHTIIESINASSSFPIINGRVFSRVANDEDFLNIRLGISDEVENMFEIKGEKKDEVLSSETFRITEQTEGVSVRTRVVLHLPDDPDYEENIDTNAYLVNLPYAIAKRYRYLHGATLLFSLKNSSCLGVVAETKKMADDFIARMIFDICYYHSPEEVQIVMLFPQTDDYETIEEQIKEYKFLPHFRELFNDKSQFVFGNNSANLVFGSTLNILSQRENSDHVKPHIVFVVYDEYSLKEHALASYLPEVPEKEEQKKNPLGISFIFIKHFQEHLPSYCTDVIRLYQDYSSITPRTDENKRKIFRWWDTWQRAGQGQIDNMAYNAYKLLSGLVYSRISQNGKVPSGISFFEMCGIDAENMGIEQNWGYKRKSVAQHGNNNMAPERIYDVTKSLSVPIGRTELGLTYLDLHEDADGPHMLVAGTTGSGKSETIISYLLSLCLHFTPEELNLMLVDMKGGGFIKRISELPHVVGMVTDVDGDESGTGDEYMVRRFLESLRCEIKRRKLLLNQMHVDSADKYIQACRNIEMHIRTLNSENSLPKGENGEIREADFLRKLAQTEKLPHLVLVVDEFTELKRFTGESDDIDFIGEITTIARVGRSLGLHIILVSQNIENAITDDIRVNSRARLCLKVATKQASKEMIGNELAASPSMPGHGRAYLLVGTGSKFVYFQSAYTGTSITDSLDVPFEIIRAEKTGEYTRFYRSDKDNLQLNKEKSVQKEQGVITQCSSIVDNIRRVFKDNPSYIRPHIIFQPPLPRKVTLKNGMRYDIK